MTRYLYCLIEISAKYSSVNVTIIIIDPTAATADADVMAYNPWVDAQLEQNEYSIPKTQNVENKE